MRDPYVFEFAGIKSKEVMGESDVEDALLDRLQDFLLELGHGFCFESRQQRINIGGEYCFVDLVFYHRVLKCHILIELLCGAPHNNSYVASPVMWRSPLEDKTSRGGARIKGHINNRIIAFLDTPLDSHRYANA